MASSTYIADTLRRPTGRTFTDRLRGGDAIAYAMTLASAAFILVIVALIVWELWTNSTDRESIRVELPGDVGF